MKNNKEQNKSEKLLMMACMLQGKNPSDMYDSAGEKLGFLFDEEATDCAFEIYLLLVKWIAEGLSYEEIEEKIESLDLESFKKLTEDKKQYIKEDINNILIRRRQMKGNDKNE